MTLIKMRCKTCLLLDKIDKNKKYADRIGVYNTSTINGIAVNDNSPQEIQISIRVNDKN